MSQEDEDSSAKINTKVVCIKKSNIIIRRHLGVVGVILLALSTELPVLFLE